MTEHLTDNNLRDFRAGRLDPDVLLRADDHLSACEVCRTRATALLNADEQIDEFHQDLTASAAQSTDEERTDDEEVQTWAAAPRRDRSWFPLAAAILIAALLPLALWLAHAHRAPQAQALAGMELLDPVSRVGVETALRDGAASLPDFFADLNAPAESLMGAPKHAEPGLALRSPLRTGTATDRPRFEWQALEGADSYTVSVFDERLNVVTRSGTVTSTTWTPTEPLPRNRTYLWQVMASRGGETVIAPAAPLPPGRFHVIDAVAAVQLQRVEGEYPQSHLLLGILNMEAGIRDEAVRHFRDVPSTDPLANVVRRSLERLGR